MSVTVVRHKNGKPITFKLSIWDAFKGVPTPVRKPKKCRCCNKVHAKKPRSAEDPKSTSKPNATSKAEPKDNVKKLEEDQPRSTRDAETYTAEDDAKIIEMKEAKKSWKEILTAINKESKSQLTEHWKTIDPSKTKAAQGERTEEKSEAEAQAEVETKAEVEKKKEEGKSKKKQKQRAPDTGYLQDVYKPEAKPTSSSDKTQSNSIKGFADQYDRRKWIAVASKHYDRTGQRITPETARMMADAGTM